MGRIPRLVAVACLLGAAACATDGIVAPAPEPVPADKAAPAQAAGAAVRCFIVATPPAD